jgi:uncharacterized membrane protein YuzA (DUF378 family)
MEDNTNKVLFAIVGIVVLEIAAMFYGIDGTVFATIIAAIAGLAGFTLRPVVEETLEKLKK